MDALQTKITKKSSEGSPKKILEKDFIKWDLAKSNNWILLRLGSRLYQLQKCLLANLQKIISIWINLTRPPQAERKLKNRVVSHQIHPIQIVGKNSRHLREKNFSKQNSSW